MYVFKRKRFVLIFFFLFFSFSTYFASYDNKVNRSYDITQVSSIPVTEKVIVIDAGHRW